MGHAKIIGGLLAAASILTIAPPAAAYTTLKYVEPAFSSIQSLAAGTGIFGFIVLRDFDGSVGQSLTAVNLVDWSISNGSYTLSSAAGSTLTRFDMQTVAGGRVTNWAFDAQDLPDPLWTKFSRTDSAFDDISIVKDNSYSGESENEGGPGSWTWAVVVPEPATWAIMLVGFGVAGTAMRFRRKIAVTGG